MSRFNSAEFNIWFPATVVSLIITIVGACVLAILRRYCPCIRRLLGNHSDTEAAPEAAPQPQGNQRREAIERMYARNHEPAADEHPVEIGDGAVVAPVTVWFPDSCLPEGFAAWVYEYIAQRAQGVVHRWRGSVVIQAMVPIDSRALRELEEFAKHCSCEVEGFYVQIGEWGIFYHNGESFQLYRLKEAEAPEIVEAVWHNSGFIVRGFSLNGSSIKEATEKSSTTLRTAGPPLQVCGLLEELFVPTEGLDVGKSLIFASRVVDVDGYLLTVRSQATYIVPPHDNSFKEPSSSGSLLKTLPFKTKMKSLLRFPGCQPKTSQRTPKRLEELEKVSKTFTQRQLLVEHWRGVSESEMLDFRTKVLHHLQQLSSGSDRHLSQYNFRTSMLVSSGDQEYWKRGLDDLDELILLNTDNSQFSVLFRIRARCELFLGLFESALLDFELADVSYDGRPSSTDMLERAIVKCALARYSEAMQDVMAAAINPNRNDVNALQTCLEQILHVKLQDEHGPQLLISSGITQEIPDLLTGDKWPSDHRTSSIISKHYSDLIRRMSDMNSGGRELLSGEMSILQAWIESVKGRQIGEGACGTKYPTKWISSACAGKEFRGSFPADHLEWPTDSSPGICRAVGVTELEEHTLVLESLSYWGDLQRLIDQRTTPFDMTTAVDFMCQVAEGMRAWHERGMVHMDLKPCNVLVNPCGEQELPDLEYHARDRETGIYRVPDLQAMKDRSHTLWKKADVWSFGITCHHILTMGLPVEDHSRVNHMVIQSGLLPPLPPTLEDPHRALRTLIEECWRADPVQRPDFAIICEELRRISSQLVSADQSSAKCYELEVVNIGQVL